jgi:hypothetical protein
MISDELQERVAAAWLAGIPERFRLTDRDKGMYGDRHLSAAIILPPPPLSLIESFLMNIFGKRHLTQNQLAARTARQNCGHPGRKDDALTSVERQAGRGRNRARRPRLSVTLSATTRSCGYATALRT